VQPGEGTRLGGNTTACSYIIMCPGFSSSAH
jgi:hypothetical protein